MWKAIKHCPCCSVLIPSRDRRRMTNIFGARKSVPCPHCGKLITYSKSNRIFLISSLIVFVLALIALLLEVLKIYEGIIVIYWILMLLFFSLRIPSITEILVISDLEEQNESQEEAR